MNARPAFKDLQELPFRKYEPEIMDSPDADPDLLFQTFRQISILNALTLAYWPMCWAIEDFVKQAPAKDWRILDLGCGNGDMLRCLEYMARREGYALRMQGWDSCSLAIRAASEATSSDFPITFLKEDALNPRTDPDCDIIITSLFMHHLNDRQIISLLRWMTRKARRGWVISDLHRHPVPYIFIRMLAFFLRCNAMIRHDSCLSVARGFTRRDWLQLLLAAGLDLTKIKISWYPNFRYVIRYEHNV